MRWTRFVLTAALVLGACTQPPGDDGSPSPSPSPEPTESPSVVPTGARLADGTPLPEGCTSGALASQTVAFVADGRAWALDPETADLACLFPVEDAGPFAWGPQGDRVLLGDFEIRGVGGAAPDLPTIDVGLGAFDWGHPLGLAVAFADGKGDPRKRFVDDGRVRRLTSMPPGDYLEVAYHPSGLALAFVIETDAGQEIWLSTNEGEDPQRLIFSKRGTTFTALAFSPKGETLWWTAEHAEGYPELHFMRLETRTGFGTAWRGERGTVAGGLRLPPAGPLQAVTEGAACAGRRALILSGGETRTALPGESRPTEALGWLDRSTLLVAAGGCGDRIDLYAVDGRARDAPAALAFEVEIASPRTQVKNPPDSVPAPQPDEEPPPEGVG
ncbi:MAG: TolB family protein [Actinomycetota bacterium]